VGEGRSVFKRVLAGEPRSYGNRGVGTVEEFVGTWLLASWSAVWAYQFVGQPDEFLYQDPGAALPRTDDAGEVQGSALAIGADGSFTQTGRADRPILTYDEEGVQVSGVAEFGGLIREESGRGYLLRREAPKRTRSSDPDQLRYDDGDTQVCDSARIIGGCLVRAMCVATDECYGDRVVLVYKRG
jgi:hypothetical protein